MVSKGPSSASSARSRRYTIKLRDIVGYSLKGARDYAREHHLSLKVEEEDSDGENDGTVLRQSPESGTEMNSGDTLTVVVALLPLLLQNLILLIIQEVLIKADQKKSLIIFRYMFRMMDIQLIIFTKT